jgi:Transcriptional regulator
MIKKYNLDQKPRGRYSMAIRILLCVFCTLVAGAVAVTFILIDYIKKPVDQTSVLFSNPQATATAKASATAAFEATPAPFEGIEYNGKSYVRNENIVNILFLGIDTNTERKINMDGYRSDMIMVCAVDIEKRTATLISIPRDTYTTVYKVNADTGAITDTLQWRINTAYSYGGGAKKQSCPNAMACVQLFMQRECELETPLDFTLDIPVYMYASIDIDGIQQIASAVGGVEITLDETIAGVGKRGQTVTLRYTNAETYLRDRHSSGQGDTLRMGHQQAFMLALAKKSKAWARSIRSPRSMTSCKST